MIKYPESKARARLTQARGWRSIYIAMLLLSFQGAVTLYVHSTYLEHFVDPKTVGILFMIGAALSIGALLSVGRLLERFGNLRLTLGFILADAVALLGMGLVAHELIVVPLFVLHQILTPLLFFTIDIFLEGMTGAAENETGGRRGMVLSLMNASNALAPLAAGILLSTDGVPNFTAVYIASAVMLVPLAAFFYTNFRDFKGAPCPDVKLLPALRTFWQNTDLRYIFGAHILLQLFFAFMVIYTPLYLATEIGFSWQAIGSIFFVALLAYVLLEYPVGIIADRYLGEQEMMAAGFMILGVSTAWLSFIATAAIIPWMVAMFMTRVGGALVESTTEIYFFKHASQGDANVIGLFRITRPLAILIGALLGSIALAFIPFQFVFAMLGGILLCGIIFATLIKDTC